MEFILSNMIEEFVAFSHSLPTTVSRTNSSSELRYAKVASNLSEMVAVWGYGYFALCISITWTKTWNQRRWNNFQTNLVETMAYENIGHFGRETFKLISFALLTPTTNKTHFTAMMNFGRTWWNIYLRYNCLVRSWIINRLLACGFHIFGICDYIHLKLVSY